VRALLGLLGRQARWALPAGVFLGIVFPRAAALLRPLLAPAVIGTLTAALLRLDWSRMGGLVRRPRLPAALAAWQLVAAPLIAWFGTAAFGLPADLRLVLLLQSAAPPIGSAAVFAMIIGLEGSLAMIGSVSMTLALPLTLTPLVGLCCRGPAWRSTCPRSSRASA
jgi:BASS family bile acid:Na+ symporter